MESISSLIAIKNNLSKTNKNNIESINKMKNMINITEQIEVNLMSRAERHMSDIDSLSMSMKETVNLLKTVCKNLS